MQQEQRELLQTLYEKHEKVLRLVAGGRGLPQEEADDAVQDTFCRFIVAYGEKFALWNERQIKSALMKIMYNRCADYYRDKKRRPDTSIEEYRQEDEYRIIADLVVPDVAEYLMTKEKLLMLREGILTMSPAMRQVAMLCLVESRTVEEACGILKITESACRMRLSRVRKYLTEWIEDPEKMRPEEQGRKKPAATWRDCGHEHAESEITL